MPLCYFGCASSWSNGMPSNHPKTKEEALTRLDEFYTSGVPFFTKDSIRSVWEQFQRPVGKSSKIAVKALDGSIVEYTVKTKPMTLRSRQKDGVDEVEEWVLYVTQPYIPK